ncbi:MAG: hypothetical protein WB439_11625 [Acidobacteriaceae bacterium]
MKRMRRTEIQIEHREISLFGVPPNPSPEGVPPGGAAEPRPDRCPVCGSLEMLLLTEAASKPGLSLLDLCRGIEREKFHLHRTPSGIWWVCRRSLRLN